MKRISENSTNNYWISFTDVISSILLIFVVLVVILFLKSMMQDNTILNQKEEIEELTTDLTESEEKGRVLTEKQKMKSSIDHFLEAVAQKDSISVKVEGKKILLESDRTFNSGSADLLPQGKESLQFITNELKPLLEEYDDIVIMVIGHTDNQPINKGYFKSNWELSFARATTAQKFLIQKGNFDKDRVLPAGYADVLPIASNEEKEGKSKNRRIELFITNRDEVGMNEYNNGEYQGEK